MISFLRPAPHKERLPAKDIDPEYKRLRMQVFLGIFIGYAAYYLVRKNVNIAMPQISLLYGITKTQMGWVFTGLSLSYGLSKFLMGSVSDRSNPRPFMTLGLILSSSIMIFYFGFLTKYFGLGTLEAGTSTFGLFILICFIMNTLNGWVQGMGWPPSGKTLVHWYSVKERGRAVAVWNVAHNIGGGLVGIIAATALAFYFPYTLSEAQSMPREDYIQALGLGVNASFLANGILGLIFAAVIYLLLRDAPQSQGLPPIEEYKNDYPPDYNETWEHEYTAKEIFLKHVFNNKFLWYIAIANAFCYFVRYGIGDWIPAYLQEQKDVSIKNSGWAWAWFEWAAIPGTLLCGWVSDRVFQGRRAPAGIIFMAATFVSVLVYKLNIHGPLIIDQFALIAAGFFIYGPIMLIGLHALDLVPKKAAGTAAGFTGFFGYVFGSAAAGVLAGFFIDAFGYNGYFIAILTSCALTAFFMALTWKHGAQSETRH